MGEKSLESGSDDPHAPGRDHQDPVWSSDPHSSSIQDPKGRARGINKCQRMFCAWGPGKPPYHRASGPPPSYLGETPSSFYSGLAEANPAAQG